MVYPAAHGLVGYHDAAFRQQILDVAEAQGKPDVKPNRLLDDFGREPVPLVAYFLHPLGYLTASDAASPNCRDNSLYRPGKQDLGRGFPDTLCDGDDHRMIQQSGLHSMPQRRKRKQHNPMSLTIFEQVPFREIRMGFDLYDRRLDSRGFNNLLQFLQIDI